LSPYACTLSLHDALPISQKLKLLIVFMHFVGPIPVHLLSAILRHTAWDFLRGLAAVVLRQPGSVQLRHGRAMRQRAFQPLRLPEVVAQRCLKFRQFTLNHAHPVGLYGLGVCGWVAANFLESSAPFLQRSCQPHWASPHFPNAVAASLNRWAF